MRSWCFSFALILSSITVVYGQSHSAKYATDWIQSYGKYVEIAGATRVGADTCANCHAENSTAFRHAYHAQQGWSAKTVTATAVFTWRVAATRARSSISSSGHRRMRTVFVLAVMSRMPRFVTGLIAHIT